MTVRDDYRKFSELLDLIQLLCRPMNGLTYEEIMEFMHCSRKTAERSIKFLADRFGEALVISSDPNNTKQHRFRLEMPDSLPPEYINANDMIGLNVATNRIKNEDIRKNLQSVCHWFESSCPSHEFSADFCGFFVVFRGVNTP